MAGVLRSLRLGSAEHLAEDAARALDAAGFAVSLLVGNGRVAEPIWCFPELSVRLEELQFTLGEGPGLDAVRTGTPVLEPDLSTVRPARWPAFLPAARELGVSGVCCFPLGIGAIRLGVLTVLCAEPRGLSRQQYDDAAALTAALTSAFLNGDRGPAQGNDGPGGAGTTMLIGQPKELGRAVVHQATGMVSVQLGVTLAEAVVRLRAYAYASERTLASVAQDVVARRLRFSDDMSGPYPKDGGEG